LQQSYVIYTFETDYEKSTRINSAISNNEDEKAIDMLKSLFLFESDKQITLLQEFRQV